MRNITKFLAFISLFVILIMFTGTVSAANLTVNPQNSVQADINTTGIVMATNDSNCGPAALATVLYKMGINTTQEELATLAGTSKNGTTMYGLQKAAQSKGLTVKGLKLPANQLKNNNIVLLTINGEGTYNVVANINNTTVSLADPNLGNINMTLNDFTAFYSGYALVVTNNKSNLQISKGTALTVKEMQSITGTGVPKGYKRTYYPAQTVPTPGEVIPWHPELNHFTIKIPGGWVKLDWGRIYVSPCTITVNGNKEYISAHYIDSPVKANPPYLFSGGDQRKIATALANGVKDYGISKAIDKVIDYIKKNKGKLWPILIKILRKGK